MCQVKSRKLKIQVNIYRVFLGKQEVQNPQLLILFKPKAEQTHPSAKKAQVFLKPLGTTGLRKCKIQIAKNFHNFLGKITKMMAFHLKEVSHLAIRNQGKGYDIFIVRRHKK